MISFLSNKGAVAGVFLIVGLAGTAILVFMIFALRKRRRRRQDERDTEIAAGLAAGASMRDPFGDDNNRAASRAGARTISPEMRARTPWYDEEDAAIYATQFGATPPPGDPSQVMPVVLNSDGSPQYTHPYALASRDTPTPNTGTAALPTYLPGVYNRAASASPSPQTSRGPDSALGHGSTRPPPSAFAPTALPTGGAYSSEGSAGTEGVDGKSSSNHSHGHNYIDQYGALTPLDPRGTNPFRESSGSSTGTPALGYAYEPEPTVWDHRVISPSSLGHDSPSPYTQAFETQRLVPPPITRANTDFSAESVYTLDGWGTDDDASRRPLPADDPRMDPTLGMRLRGGLASQHSFGPRDHEDYTRRLDVSFHSCSFQCRSWLIDHSDSPDHAP